MAAKEGFVIFTSEKSLQEVLTCSECQNTFKNEVFIENGRNVCGSCSKKRQVVLMENVQLREMLKCIKVPCKFYKEFGCDEILPYSELGAHQELCRFKTTVCPLSTSTKCLWIGKTADHQKHYRQEHSDWFVENPFELNITLTKDEEILKLIEIGHQLFLLRIKIDLKNSAIYYVIYKYDSTEKEFEYTISHLCAKESNIFKLRHRTISGNLQHIYDESKCLKLDLTSLKNIICAGDNLTFIIKIADENLRKKFDENMLQFFECPVCKNYMRPPIFQCNSGHSICNVCRPRLDKCPTCRSMIGNTRNFNLEGLTLGVNYPCVYHDLGCKVVLTADNIKNHEADCPLKSLECPISKCNYIGNISSVYDHLDVTHNNRVIRNEYFEQKVEFRLSQESMQYYMTCDEFCFLSFGLIFKLSYKRNIDYSYWAVEIIGCLNEGEKYIYEIGIIDLRKNCRRLIRRDACLFKVSGEDLFKKCIMFPNNTLNSYAVGHLLYYYCKISKECCNL